MKTIKITLFALLLTYSCSITAQEYEHAIRFNLLGSIVGQYHLFYEKALNEKFTAQLSAGYITRSSEITYGDEVLSKSVTNGFLVIPEGRFYFKESLQGFYTGAFFRYKKLSLDYPDLSGIEPDWSYTVNRSTIGGGLVLGVSSTFGDIVSCDFFVGPHFKSVQATKSFKNPNVTEDEVPTFAVNFLDDLFAEKSGTGVRLGINLGIVF